VNQRRSLRDPSNLSGSGSRSEMRVEWEDAETVGGGVLAAGAVGFSVSISGTGTDRGVLTVGVVRVIALSLSFRALTSSQVIFCACSF
jgi:hypothetical protein